MAKLLTGTRIYGTGTVDTQLFVSGTNSATSTTTGALQVVGGVGVGGNLYVGGTIYGAVLGTATTATNADNVKTVLQTANAAYYPAFVDSNNSTAAYETLYTTASFYINPVIPQIVLSRADSSAQLVLQNTTSTTARYPQVVIQNFDSFGGMGVIELCRGRGSSSIPQSVLSGDLLGGFNTWGHNGGSMISATRINGVADSTFSTTASAYLSFLTTFNSVQTEKVRITASGNAGIGDTAPGARLTVLGAGGSTLGTNGYLVHVGGTDSSVDPVRYMIGFSHGNNSTSTNVRAAIGSMITTGGAGNLIFETGGSFSGQVERMRITGLGGVSFGASGTAYGVSGQILQSNGNAAPTWISTGSLAAANATTATHLSGGTAGQVPYQTAPGVTSFYGPGTAGNVLVSNGTSAPSYNNTLTLTGTTAATNATSGALQIAGGVGINNNLFVTNNINAVSGQFVSTRANNATTDAGQILLNGATGNRIDFNVNGVAGPAFTTRSAGTKLVLYPAVGASAVDFALGIDSNTMWFSTYDNAGGQFKWYHGITNTMVLAAGGNLTLVGDLAVNGGDITTTQTTFNLINTTATTVNFAGAATTLTMGASGSGTTNVRNNLTVSGNLTVQGTTTIVDSTVTNIADPIITLGGGTGNSAPTADDNKDRGVAFKWVNNGGTTSTGFFGYDDSTGHFTYVQTATITNEVVSGTKGAMDVNLAGGSAMAIVYQSSLDNTAFLAAGSSGFLLQTNGTGSAPTWVSASGVSAGSATNADNIRTISQAGSAVYYPTFVDSNNASHAYESVYTTSSFSINPATGAVSILGLTTSTANKLQIGQTSVPSTTFTSTTHLRIIGTANTATDEVFITLVRDRNPSIQYAGGAAISLGSYITPTAASAPSSRLTFSLKSSTDNSDVVNVQVMSLLDNGNVGIGTQSPVTLKSATTLQVNGNVKLGNANDRGLLSLGDIASTSANVGIWRGGAGAYNAAGNYLNLGGYDGITFITGNTSIDSQTERVRIDTSGNLLVGDSNSGYGKLTITGSTSTSGVNIWVRNTSDTAGDNVKYAGIQFSVGTDDGSTAIRSYRTNSGADYSSALAFLTKGVGAGATTPTERMRLTANGGIAFGGASNYGSSGFVLKSNGDAAPTWVDPSTLASASATNADNIRTVRQTANATYYPAFVDSNNASNAYELVYTTSSFSINPGTGAVTSPSLTVNGRQYFNGSASFYSLGSFNLGSAQWVLLGRFTGGTTGETLNLQFYGASGYNGTINQHSRTFIQIRNGNGNTLDTNVSVDYHTEGQSLMVMDVRVQNVDSPAVAYGTTWDVYVQINGVCGNAYYIPFINSGATWSHTGTAGVTAPTVSSTVISGTNLFMMNSTSWFGNNVGIGTVSPAVKLDITQPNNTEGDTTLRVYANNRSQYTGISFNSLSSTYYLRLQAGTGQYLTLETNSTEKMRVTSAGGISFGASGTAYGTSGQILQSNGDAAPTWIALSSRTVGTSTQVNTVLQTASASYFPTFVDSNNASATAESLYTTSSFSINPQSGNVGIGTTSPAAKLDLYNAADAGSAANGIRVQRPASYGQYGYLEYLVSSDVTVLGSLYTGGTASTYGQIYFRQHSNGGAIKDAMVINSSNNVGIGTTSPGYPLVVQTNGTSSSPSPSGSNIALRLQSTQTNYAVSIQFSDNVTNAAFITMQGGGFRFTTSNPGAVQAMNISSSGNVSIGTTSTTNKFEVAGTAGQLFSVSDSFTGTIFSVNDVSGIPSIEVLDTGLIKMAQYNGAVAIGTGTITSSTAELSVYGMLYTLGSQGEIRASSEITAYFSSDQRLKENIKLIENPITIIDQIRGVTFDWTDEHMARRGGEDGYFVRKHDIGVIAQEVQAVLPELVGTREDGYLAVKYEKMVPLLIEAIKAQQKTIDSLVKDLDDVKEFINDLKNKNGI